MPTLLTQQFILYCFPYMICDSFCFVNRFFLVKRMYTEYKLSPFALLNYIYRKQRKRANQMISSFLLIPAMTYSPTKRIRSTIGAGGLNFCVRDGYRCDPSAIITRIIFFSLKFPSSGSLKTTQCIMFQPYIILSFTCVLVKPSTY